MGDGSAYIDGHWDWDNYTGKDSKTGTKPLNLEQEFIDAGLPVIKAPRDIKVELGLQHVKERLKIDSVAKMPCITFEPELQRTWYEMTHYQMVPPSKQDPTRHKPRIRKVDDDFPDCVRIMVTSNPRYAATSTFVMPEREVVVDKYGLGF
jgi:hypothetical protein